LDATIARMYYFAGLSFNVARNPYYQESYTFAANHSISGYVPPGYNKLRTTLFFRKKGLTSKPYWKGPRAHCLKRV